MRAKISGLNNLKKRLKDLGVEVAYLFGSRASGTATASSDLDLACLLPTHLSKAERFRTRLAIIDAVERSTKLPADVVIFNDLNSVFFKYIIVAEGLSFYIGNQERMIELELRTMSEYFDFKPFLDAYNKQYVKDHAR